MLVFHVIQPFLVVSTERETALGIKNIFILLFYKYKYWIDSLFDVVYNEPV